MTDLVRQMCDFWSALRTLYKLYGCIFPLLSFINILLYPDRKLLSNEGVFLEPIIEMISRSNNKEN